MADDQDEQVDVEAEAQAAAPADGKRHPIKELEALFKRHLGHTKELAGHVTTVAEQAQGAFAGVTRLIGDFRAYRTQAATDLAEVKRRIDALEASAAPALSTDLAEKADDVEKAVADVATAAGAVEAEGESVVTAASAAQGG